MGFISLEQSFNILSGVTQKVSKVIENKSRNVILSLASSLFQLQYLAPTFFICR